MIRRQNLDLILVDPQALLCQAWQTHFRGLPLERVVNDYALAARADLRSCLISIAWSVLPIRLG